jgi:hypothetical protein
MTEFGPGVLGWGYKRGISHLGMNPSNVQGRGPTPQTVDYADASRSPRTQARTTLTPSSAISQPFVGLASPGRVPPAMPYTAGSAGLVDPSKKGGPSPSTSSYLLTPHGVLSPNAVMPLDRPLPLGPKVQGFSPHHQSSQVVVSDQPVTLQRRAPGPHPRVEGSPPDQDLSKSPPSLQLPVHLARPSPPGPRSQGLSYHPMFPPEVRSYAPAGGSEAREAREIAGRDKVLGVSVELTTAQAGRYVDDAAINLNKSQATLLGFPIWNFCIIVSIVCASMCGTKGHWPTDD